MPHPFNHISDEELMIAYADGSNAAFETLYQRYESAMLAFIRRTLGPSFNSHAEEVFQVVWLRIINARHTYMLPENGGATWKTWAYTIAHRIAIDNFRAQNKLISLELVNEDDDPLEWIQSKLDITQPSAEDTSFWQAAGKQLLACIENLPVEQRAAFLLHHDENHSIETMAELLKTPFETLKSRLRYAMKKLRKCMSNYLNEIGETP